MLSTVFLQFASIGLAPLLTLLGAILLIPCSIVLVVTHFPWLFVLPGFRKPRVRLYGKSVLITGAASGLGRDIAKAVLSEVIKESKAILKDRSKQVEIMNKKVHTHSENDESREQKTNLVLVDVDAKNLEATRKELLTTLQEYNRLINVQQIKVSINVHCFFCDLRVKESVTSVIEEIKQRIAPAYVGILINNAGIRAAKTIEDISLAHFERTFKVNTFSHVLLVQQFIREMKANHEGHIVGICSLMSYMPSAKLSDYCASKAASAAFYDCLRLELYKEKLDAKMTRKTTTANTTTSETKTTNINVLTVYPYVIQTRMFQGAFVADKKSSCFARFRNFIWPPIESKKAAQRIILALQRQEQFLVIYNSLRIVPFLLRLLPTGMYDYIVSCFGGTHEMDSLIINSKGSS